MLPSGSVHHHAFPEISSGIQPFLPCDYLLLSAKACFGCAQPAYCQLSGPTFRITMQNKGKRDDRITSCNASMQKTIFVFTYYSIQPYIIAVLVTISGLLHYFDLWVLTRSARIDTSLLHFPSTLTASLCLPDFFSAS